jgi:hypothetical protein
MKQRHFRPRLEVLEDRRLLSATVLVSEHESNDTFRTAQALPSATEVHVAGSISSLRDVDYFRFQAGLGQTIALNCNDTSGRPDPHQQFDSYIGLFDPTGRLVATNDDGGVGSRWASALRQTATMTGTWTVAVTDYGDFNFSGIGGDHDGFGTDTGNYLLQVQVESPRPDLQVVSLAWDAAQGGLTFRYAVSGALPAGTTPQVELFWASGSQPQDRIGGPITIPSFQPDGQVGTHTAHVDGVVLRGAPARAEYLQLVLDRGQSLTEVREDNNVLVLHDVQVVLDSGVHGPLSPYTMGVLRDLLREAGQATVHMTRFLRTPQEQAHDMFDNCFTLGVPRQLALYGPAGQAVVDVYASDTQGLTRQQIQARRQQIEADMAEEIDDQGPVNVSHHMADPSVLQAIDIAPSSFSSSATQTRFLNAVRNDSRVSRLRTPPNDPAYHMEIVQPRPSSR